MRFVNEKDLEGTIKGGGRLLARVNPSFYIIVFFILRAFFNGISLIIGN